MILIVFALIDNVMVNLTSQVDLSLRGSKNTCLFLVKDVLLFLSRSM